MTVTLMWEARAVPGRGAELLEWARAQRLAARPLRRETFTAPQDRVLVLTWWETPEEPPGQSPQVPGRSPQAPGRSSEPAGRSRAYPELPELPEPPAELVTRPVHRWRFASHGVD
ncbi:hypothetical protein [Streptomyces sp. DH12]|uniref:hypothetical protein n=1 Tax=Streptomyces sp. DH12 TaxID=2857010 RepID=UPI001E48699F|nr:hypothetical protein [Streptomyces sp. DH12]